MVSVRDFDRFVFIVGAPRCGTTTLAHFLKSHPAICFPVVKEPHYFAQSDLRGLRFEALRERVEDEYLRRFFRWEPNRRIGTDASVTYLYMPEQLEPALRIWPESRFIVALRDPLKMLPSLHRRLIYIGDESIRRFEHAWSAVDDRAKGRRIPRGCIEPRWLRYDEAGRFGTYVERLFATVGRERCQVVLFDDLEANPAAEYQRLTKFLGLEAVDDVDLQPRRTGADIRFHWLQRMLKRPPKALRKRLAGEQFHQRIRDVDAPETHMPKTVLNWRKRLLRWNRVPPRAQSVPISVQHEIRRKLRDEIDRLGHLIGRDLSSWLRPDSLDQPSQEGKSYAA